MKKQLEFNKGQLKFDEGQLKLAKNMLNYWKAKCNIFERAVKNGRCDECNSPLMFDEKETCDVCLCPE